MRFRDLAGAALRLPLCALLSLPAEARRGSGGPAVKAAPKAARGGEAEVKSAAATCAHWCAAGYEQLHLQLRERGRRLPVRDDWTRVCESQCKPAAPVWRRARTLLEKGRVRNGDEKARELESLRAAGLYDALLDHAQRLLNEHETARPSRRARD